MRTLEIDAIVKAVGGRLLNEEALKAREVHRVVKDSREVEQGDLYVAIVGERFDGHDYLKQSYENGAVIAFVQNESKVPKECAAILVEDTIKALGHLAAYYRNMFDIPFVGVTGSVGKTSTKDLIASILGMKYCVHKTAGNYNNDIGLPLTLLDLEEEHEVAVIEMGMNHFGEIDYLSNILKPDYGVIVNVGVSHIEFLGSRDGILKAKTEMLPHVKETGRIILNGDDDMLQRIVGEYRGRVDVFGYNQQNDCRIIGHDVDGYTQKVAIKSPRYDYEFEVAYPGKHLMLNALPGILIGEYLGVEPDDIIRGIQNFKASKMRLEQHEVKGKLRIINDAYNASVESMQSALDTLMAVATDEERTVAILGSMFEMGSYAKEGHETVGSYVSTVKPDLLLVSGTEAKYIYDMALDKGYEEDKAFYYETRELLIESLDKHIREKDLVLLKASRGMKYEEIKDVLLRKFEE